MWGELRESLGLLKSSVGWASGRMVDLRIVSPSGGRGCSIVKEAEFGFFSIRRGTCTSGMSWHSSSTLHCSGRLITGVSSSSTTEVEGRGSISMWKAKRLPQRISDCTVRAPPSSLQISLAMGSDTEILP